MIVAPVVQPRLSCCPVEPQLYNSYSPEQAVAAFGGQAPKFLCDGQFAVLPGAVLCFFTVGDPATQPHPSTPSSIVWKPQRLNYVWFDSYPWLPHKVREVYDRRPTPSVKIKQHHLFLRSPGDETYRYVGPAHLASFGGPLRGGSPGEQSADFILSQKLPRDMWLEFGGYPGWQIEVNHLVHRVDRGDLQRFRELAAEVPRLEFSHLRVTRYEEDSLTLHTNAARGWLMYERDPGDGGVYTHDAQYGGDPERKEIFRCVCGIELDFPARDTLPRELALQVAEEFFTTGQLPRLVPWPDS